LRRDANLDDAEEVQAWKITTTELGKRLKENSIELVEDALMLRVDD
jgi:hypothetical protein